MTRSTQAERRASTRRAILDATVEVLVDQGYAGATTTAIVRRAGMSQGALFRHFPTKADLFGACVEDLFPRLVEQYAAVIAQAATADPDASVATVVLHPLLQAMERPDVRAAAELVTASRTDPDLAARLDPVQRTHREHIRTAGRELLGSVTGGPPADADAHGNATIDAAIDLAVDLTWGIALSGARDPARVTAQLELAGRLLDDLLRPANPTHDPTSATDPGATRA